MSPEEVNRFLKTVDALEPRRKVYQHPIDESSVVVEMIKESIRQGGDRPTDMINYIRGNLLISNKDFADTIKSQEDNLWTWISGFGTTRHYRLLNEE